MASYSGHLDIVKLLVDNDADINAEDMFGSTSLELASDKGHLEICEILINNGADVNSNNNNGCTPLFWAGYYGHTDVVKLLLEYGADITIRTIGDSNCLKTTRKYGKKNTYKN